MNEDCGISSRGSLYYGEPSHNGTAQVPASDCIAFKTYAVTDDVITNFENPVCGNGTDDYVSTGVTLKNGERHRLAQASGCSDDPGLKELRQRINRMSDFYIGAPAPDAGTDTPAGGG